MKFSKITLLFMVSGSFLFAQNQKFTIAEAVNGLRSNLAVKNISQFSWSGDHKAFYQSVKNGYLVTEVQSMKQDTLVSLTQLNKNLSAENKLKSFPRITFINQDKALLHLCLIFYYYVQHCFHFCGYNPYASTSQIL